MKRLLPYPGFPDRKNHGYRSHFHALARAIIYQQLSGKAAKTIHDRVCALRGSARFPTPAELLELEVGHMRSAGLSAAKVLALRDLAEKVDSGAVPLTRIARLSDERIIESLVEVRGIGEWSAQMFLLFRLGRLDVMPTADLGVQEGLRRLDGLAERPRPKEVLARSEVWRPLRSVASWYMWRMCDPEPRGV
jgi:DNA-3-methyladenine glycosylase II